MLSGPPEGRSVVLRRPRRRRRFVAYHVVPPGGSVDCLVQWDRSEKRYEDGCSGAPVDPSALARFPVLTRAINDKISVFVDVRTPAPPTAPAAPAAPAG